MVSSRERGQTTEGLAHWVLSVADRSLRVVYGENYSVRCLQASECIRALLERLGIRCSAVKGALCIAAVYPGPPLAVGWNGFWGKDHHVWVMTEFSECIDLTVSQLHVHPASLQPTLPVPAIWWHPADEWPPIIRYLPEGPIKSALPPDEMDDLDRIWAEADRLYEAEFNLPERPAVSVPPILLGPESLNDLDRAADPWLTACRAGLPFLSQFPEWVSRREEELMKRFEASALRKRDAD